VTLADVLAGTLPDHVRELTARLGATLTIPQYHAERPRPQHGRIMRPTGGEQIRQQGSRAWLTPLAQIQRGTNTESEVDDVR
jgi:hypothetical protein